MLYKAIFLRGFGKRVGAGGQEEWWLGIYTQKVNVLKLKSVRTKIVLF